VIITDIIMPEKDGVSTNKEIRQDFPGITIIAIPSGGSIDPSTYTPEAINTSAYLAAGQQAGADRIFTKPFERMDLTQDQKKTKRVRVV